MGRGEDSSGVLYGPRPPRRSQDGDDSSSPQTGREDSFYEEVQEAKRALVAVAATRTDGWWRAYELKDEARSQSGFSGNAISVAFNRLVSDGEIELGASDQVRLVKTS